MTLRNLLLSNASFTFERNIFYQKELRHGDPFEKNYIELRKRENRVYSDEVVRNLPDFDQPDSLKKEWMVRKITMTKLISHFKKKNDRILILELGCGNGWLSHQLAVSLHADIIGLDINEVELLQGAELFRGCENLSFLQADIFTADIKPDTFDIILLASSIQYFPDLKQLIDRLLELVKPAGEIHVVDSPLYKSVAASSDAKKRSFDYFNSLGVPEMTDNYFHHRLRDLKTFNYEILYDPHSLWSLFTRKILNAYRIVFPWILIQRF